MKFLSTLKNILTRATTVASIVLPWLQGFAPPRVTAITTEVSDDLTKIGGIVVAVEGAAGALSSPVPGAEKAKMTGPLIAQVILKSDLMVGHKVKNPDLFLQGCTAIGGGVADVINSLEEA